MFSLEILIKHLIYINFIYKRNNGILKTDKEAVDVPPDIGKDG